MGITLRPIDLINKTIRMKRTNILRDIAYGDGARQAMDIYLPEHAAGSCPVVVFFYGGGWQSGARADYAFIGALLAAKGFIVAVPDYRVFPDVKYPGFVEDCATATRWVMARISSYGGDAGKVFLMGHSAGAYNAVMVALAADAPKLSGVIGLAGPYDFLPLKSSSMKAIFGGTWDMRETQPISYVHSEAPPMFLATGTDDRRVLPRNTTALAARLRQEGALVETKIYPCIGHIGILTALLPYVAWRAPVWRDVLSFMAGCDAGESLPTGSEISPPMVRRSL